MQIQFNLNLIVLPVLFNNLVEDFVKNINVLVWYLGASKSFDSFFFHWISAMYDSTWKNDDSLKARKCCRSLIDPSFESKRADSLLNFRICSFNVSSGQRSIINSVLTNLSWSWRWSNLSRIKTYTQWVAVSIELLFIFSTSLWLLEPNEIQLQHKLVH